MRRVHFLVKIVWTCAYIGAFVKTSSAADDSVPAPSRPHKRDRELEQQCRDKLPAALINDDYCDCLDGSDETGKCVCV